MVSGGLVNKLFGLVDLLAEILKIRIYQIRTITLSGYLILLISNLFCYQGDRFPSSYIYSEVTEFYENRGSTYLCMSRISVISCCFRAIVPNSLKGESGDDKTLSPICRSANPCPNPWCLFTVFEC